jgi:hypothetical protein
MSDGTRAERGVIFLLLPAIVIGVLVLTGVTFRTSFQQERLREQSVVEATLSLANERAARLDQLIIDQDAVVAAETDVGDLGKLARTWLAVAARQTPTVRAVLVLDLESPMHRGSTTSRSGGSSSIACSSISICGRPKTNSGTCTSRTAGRTTSSAIFSGKTRSTATSSSPGTTCRASCTTFCPHSTRCGTRRVA